MGIFKNLTILMKQYSLSEIIKFVIVAGLFVFIAFLFIKFLLILIVVGLSIRLIAPYMGLKFSRKNFEYDTVSFKVVGEEEKKANKK